VSAVNLGDVGARFDSGEVTVDALKEKGLIPRSATLVKILGDGQFSKKLTIVAHYFSNSAKEKLEKAGGTARVLEQQSSKEAAPAQ
jgi:large subunit ribosomal protein L15